MTSPLPIGPLLQSLRPHQWVKNGVVLAPLVFAHKAGDAAAWQNAGLAVAIFCALSSAVYLLNDIVDRESDRRHPQKKFRPIPAGRLGVPTAIVAMLVLAGSAALGAAWLSAAGPRLFSEGTFWIWPAAYAALNLAYSFGLKHQVIVDCLCIALGFQFRVQAGSAAISVQSSKWILLCTFFFALFLAFCKRREELARSGGNAAARATMQHYTVPFLDQLIAPLAALSILTYALYTLDTETFERHGTRNLMFTVPFVVFGVFRYVFLIHTRGGGEDPARLLFRDRPLLISGVAWGIAVSVILTAR